MKRVALILTLVAALSATTRLAAAPALRATRPIAGVDVGGRIVDRAGAPIRDARVSIVELGRATTSDANGKFLFAGLPAARYTLSVRRIGYTSAVRVLAVGELSTTLTITLESGALPIQPVNITGTRTPTEALASPLSLSTLSSDQLRADAGISLSHAVSKLAGVRSVTSGQQIGKPMVRGMFGPRVLVLADGSRIEDYSWSDEDGPSIDARLAERIEVIRGPASVLYGSEALSGVVNVIPGELLYSADGSPFRHEGLEAYGGSNNIELGGAGHAEGGKGKYGWRGLATGRFSLNYQTPKGEEPNSSFWAFNGELAGGMRGDHGSTTLRVSHYGGEFHLLEASGPEPGDPDGGPVRQTLDDRIQLTNDYLTHGVRFETKAQWQRHGLAEVSDDCQPVPPATTCTKVKDQQAFGLVLNTGTVDVLAHHTVGEHVTGTIGVSGMFQLSSGSGPIFLVPDATTNAAAAFAFEQATFGIVTFAGGIRGDTRHLSSDANTNLSLTADTRSWSDASMDGGVVVRPIEHLALVGNYGTGWRAPTLFDLYTNGPNQADARFEVGDKTLKTEHAQSLDGGIRWASDRANAEATVYQNDVDRFIYIGPTGAFNGTLPIFAHRQVDARFTGAEVSGAIQVATPLSLRAGYDFVRGSNRVTKAPLPLVPPPRTIVGAEWRLTNLGWAQRASIGAEVENNQTQTRRDPNDIPTNGYTLVNLDFRMDRAMRGQAFRFDVDVRNATNVAYKDYLSRYKGFAYAQGVNVILKAAVGAW